jgi:nitroreductase
MVYLFVKFADLFVGLALLRIHERGDDFVTEPSLANGMTPRKDRLPDWAAPAWTVRAALLSRKAIRSFLPTPVPRGLIESMLAEAARAPSGTNTQPWRVRVLSDAPLARLSSTILGHLADPQASLPSSGRERHYPAQWPSPYLERRRKVGWDLYGLLGITREQRERIDEQRNRNFRFFDAPVGLIFTIDDRLREGSWLDYGMFLQSLMLSARAHGLGTCPQAAFTQFSELIATELGLPANEAVVCGMSLGYPDPEARVNMLETERAPVGEFASFDGFEPESTGVADAG